MDVLLVWVGWNEDIGVGRAWLREFRWVEGLAAEVFGPEFESGVGGDGNEGLWGV